MATNKKKKPVIKSKARAAAALKTPFKLRKGVKKPLVVHHRHTFKLVHHSHTNYALQMFILLLVGIFCVGWTSLANGDTYDVHAIVPAVPLTQPATITAPGQGAVFTTATHLVGGNCPANSYVKLFRNDVFAGTSLCQSDGTWSVQTDYVVGSNRLLAKDYNVTDQVGPDSNVVTVTFTPPVEDPGSGTGTGTGAGTPTTPSSGGSNAPSKTTKTTNNGPATGTQGGPPITLGSDFTYKGYAVGEEGEWTVTLAGGSEPYAVQIDWGDGETDLQSVAHSGAFTIKHTYSQVGGFKNSYIIKVTATDSDGNKTVLQLFTIISAVATGSGSSGLSQLDGSGGAVNTSDSLIGQSIYQQFIKVALPTLALSFVAVGSFWLGEAHQVGAVGRHLVRFHTPRRWHLRF